MDEIVPADPPPTDADAAPPVRKRVKYGGRVDIDVHTDAPTRNEMQSEEEKTSTDDDDDATIPAVTVTLVVKMQNLCQDIFDELRHLRTYLDCLDTCFFFFICHGITSLILDVTVCCGCYTSMLKMPDRIEKRTARTHTIFAFLAKHLSTMWVSSLLLLYARWVLFRPMDVKPHLGASTVHRFELTPTGALRFNVTTYVLFHNAHNFYDISYNYLAGNFLYADVKLGPVHDDELPSFTQKPHESTLERLPFAGLLRNASGTVEDTFARERAQGLLQMSVRIQVLLHYGFYPFKGDYFTVYDCPMISPFPQTGEPAAVSSPARCKNVHV